MSFLLTDESISFQWDIRSKVKSIFYHWRKYVDGKFVFINKKSVGNL